jgi:hypothetical protein
VYQFMNRGIFYEVCYRWVLRNLLTLTSFG